MTARLFTAFPLLVLFGLLAGLELPIDSIGLFFGLYFGAFLIYSVAAWLSWRRPGLFPVSWVVGGALLFRLILLPTPPQFSDDIYRYAWEGTIQWAGVNPYSHAPDAPELEELRQDYPALHAGVNHPEVSAAYPPGMLLFHAGAAGLSSSLYAQKALSVLFDALLLFLLLRWLRGRGQEERLILYAWNPLVILEFAGSGHHDSIVLFFLIGAIFLVTQGRFLAAPAALALATMGKFWPVLFLPWVLRKEKALLQLGVFAGLVGLCYMPFLGAGRNLFHGLGEYGIHWVHNDFLFTSLGHLLGDAFYSRVTLGLLLLGSLVWMYWRRWSLEGAAGFLVGGLLLLSPTLHPWYVTWAVPLLCLRFSPAMFYWSGAVVVSYEILPGWLSQGTWTASSWVWWVQYPPILVLLAWQMWQVRRRVRAPGPPNPGTG